MQKPVIIIGGGLAGCEAAWQIAKRGFKVKLFEMRPEVQTEAHKTSDLAELICSNSFRSNAKDHAAGLIKEELRLLDSLIIKTADNTAVPAGGCLSVDRERFSSLITETISNHKNIEVVRNEVTKLPTDSIVIVASGPLTSKAFSINLSSLLNSKYLYFYDAISPILNRDSIDFSKAFFASRYGKGGADYLNCPMTEDEYNIFYESLINASKVPLKGFENIPPFEACMPVEDIAARGKRTLLFGPMKPVGLTNPKTGRRSYAVLQLRKENIEGTMFNMVGFQTKLSYKAQDEVFRKIPGLKGVEFLRYGSVHKNTYIDSPKLLNSAFSMKKSPDIFFAGQITGVEGYIESTASGLVAGLNVSRLLENREPLTFPDTTAHGSLINYITGKSIDMNSKKYRFQPMHINLGLFPEVFMEGKKNKQEKKRLIVERAINDMNGFITFSCIT